MQQRPDHQKYKTLKFPQYDTLATLADEDLPDGRLPVKAVQPRPTFLRGQNGADIPSTSSTPSVYPTKNGAMKFIPSKLQPSASMPAANTCGSQLVSWRLPIIPPPPPPPPADTPVTTTDEVEEDEEEELPEGPVYVRTLSLNPVRGAYGVFIRAARMQTCPQVDQSLRLAPIFHGSGSGQIRLHKPQVTKQNSQLMIVYPRLFQARCLA